MHCGLCKYLNIAVLKTAILTVVVCGRATWSLVLREQ